MVYQVYLRSFADGDNDGTGDIAGLRARLPYLVSLGVDAVWVNPWYASPLNDGGYDVADYRSIHPLFGTLAEAKQLIAEANQLGIRFLVDLVPNHTSSEHVWFKGALSSGPGSAARGRYHFLPGKGSEGQLPPNDWQSAFGGPAWTRVPDGEWYLHMFDATQADLNWENPEVRAEFIEILRFWMDLGVSGFRVDVAHALVKEPGYPDSGLPAPRPLEATTESDHPLFDRPGLHEIIGEWRSVLDEYPGSVMIAEAWVPDWSRLSKFARPGEYNQLFDFSFLLSPWEPESLKRTVRESIAAMAGVGGVPSWVLSNHDVIRHATRYGLPQDLDARRWLLDGDRSVLDRDLGLRRARAAALLMLALPGSVYLYQGEELGLHEVPDLPESLLDDPVWERSGHTEKGRDGCRVPIPWGREGPSFGFCDGGSWLPQPDTWGDLSVEKQLGEPESTLELYRALLRIRSQLLVGDEELEWLDMGSDVLAFARGNGVVCIVNFGPEDVLIHHGTILVSSEKMRDGLLPQDSAVWLSQS